MLIFSLLLSLHTLDSPSEGGLFNEWPILPCAPLVDSHLVNSYMEESAVDGTISSKNNQQVLNMTKWNALPLIGTR
jgi:hypothetical protein